MTNLTEQWKKGELPEGFYYVADGAEVTIDYYLCDYWERHFDRDVQQVLAPVPSYEEWKQLHKFLEEFNALDVAKENQQLKELLRKCRSDLMSCFAVGYEDSEFIKKITNAIGEKNNGN